MYTFKNIENIWIADMAKGYGFAFEGFNYDVKPKPGHS